MACWDTRLGLSLDDTNSVMRAMGFEVPPAAAVPAPKPDANTPAVGPVKPAAPTVGTRDSAPPLVSTKPPPGQATPPVSTTPPPSVTQPQAKKPGILAPLLTGAGAGFLVGGPAGAVVGAGAALLLAPKK